MASRFTERFALPRSSSRCFAALLLAACASQPGTHPSRTERVIAASSDEGTLRSYDAATFQTATSSASRDSVIQALQATYSNLGIEVTLLDPQTGDIGNPKFSRVARLGDVPLSRYVSCGTTATGYAADSYRVTMSLVSRVTANASPGGSSVRTQLDAYAQDLGTGNGRVSCSTTGALETRINKMALAWLGTSRISE
jgi:hypothetical protein